MKKQGKGNKKNHKNKQQKIQKKKPNRGRKSQKKIPEKNKRQNHSDNEQGTDQIIQSKKDNILIAKNDRKGFSLRVQKKYGPDCPIKTKQQASTNAKKTMTSLKTLLKKFTGNDNLFGSHQYWRIGDELLMYKFFYLNKRLLNKFQKIMFYMDEAFIHSLVLQGRQLAPLIIISHVKFENLTSLRLKNMVVSLQPLAWIDCPNLNSLFIQSTDIVSIKTLNKTNWKSLSYLEILNNNVQNCELERIRMKKGSTLKVVQTNIPFRRNITPYQNICMQDIRQLARCQVQWSGLPQNIIFCYNRISQKKIVKRLNSTPIMQFNEMNEESQSELL